MWQANRVKKFLLEAFPNLKDDGVYIANWSPAEAPPAIYIDIDFITKSKEEFEEIKTKMEAVAVKASKKVAVSSEPLSCLGWDYVPPPKPEDNRTKVKTLEIRTAAGSFICKVSIEFGEVNIQIDREVFGDTEDEMLVVLGDGQLIDGNNLPIAKW